MRRTGRPATPPLATTKRLRLTPAEARAILEDAANGKPASKRRAKEEKGFGTLMHERFKKSGLTEEEAREFQKGIDELNAGWQMRIPNFEE